MEVTSIIDFNAEFIDALAKAIARELRGDHPASEAPAPHTEAPSGSAPEPQQRPEAAGSQPEPPSLDDIKAAIGAVRTRLISPDWEAKRAAHDPAFEAADAQLKKVLRDLANQLGAKGPLGVAPEHRAKFISSLTSITRGADGNIGPF